MKASKPSIQSESQRLTKIIQERREKLNEIEDKLMILTQDEDSINHEHVRDQIQKYNLLFEEYDQCFGVYYKGKITKNRDILLKHAICDLEQKILDNNMKYEKESSRIGKLQEKYNKWVNLKHKIEKTQHQIKRRAIRIRNTHNEASDGIHSALKEYPIQDETDKVHRFVEVYKQIIIKKSERKAKSLKRAIQRMSTSIEFFILTPSLEMQDTPPYLPCLNMPDGKLQVDVIFNLSSLMMNIKQGRAKEFKKRLQYVYVSMCKTKHFLDNNFIIILDMMKNIRYIQKSSFKPIKKPSLMNSQQQWCKKIQSIRSHSQKYNQIEEELSKVSAIVSSVEEKQQLFEKIQILTQKRERLKLKFETEEKEQHERIQKDLDSLRQYKLSLLQLKHRKDSFPKIPSFPPPFPVLDAPLHA